MIKLTFIAVLFLQAIANLPSCWPQRNNPLPSTMAQVAVYTTDPGLAGWQISGPGLNGTLKQQETLPPHCASVGYSIISAENNTTMSFTVQPPLGKPGQSFTFTGKISTGSDLCGNLLVTRPK